MNEKPFKYVDGNSFWYTFESIICSKLKPTDW